MVNKTTAAATRFSSEYKDKASTNIQDFSLDSSLIPFLCVRWVGRLRRLSVIKDRC